MVNRFFWRNREGEESGDFFCEEGGGGGGGGRGTRKGGGGGERQKEEDGKGVTNAASFALASPISIPSPPSPPFSFILTKTANQTKTKNRKGPYCTYRTFDTPPFSQHLPTPPPPFFLSFLSTTTKQEKGAKHKKSKQRRSFVTKKYTSFFLPQCRPDFAMLQNNRIQSGGGKKGGKYSYVVGAKR